MKAIIATATKRRHNTYNHVYTIIHSAIAIHIFLHNCHWALAFGDEHGRWHCITGVLIITTPCTVLLFIILSISSALIGNQTQINGPNKWTTIDKEWNPFSGNIRVANKIHQGPKAGTGQPRLGQVLCNLPKPSVETPLSWLNQGGSEKDTSKAGTKDQLSQGSLL